MTRILFDMKLRPRYAAMGNYARFIPALVVKPGLKGALEQKCLGLQRYIPNIKIKMDDMSAFAGLERFLNAPMGDGLFFHTAWYKDTQWIGAMAHKGSDYFVKIFKQSEECLFETRQHVFVRDHFNGPFVTVPVSMASHVHMMMPLVPRVRGIQNDDYIVEKLLLVHNTFMQDRAMRKRAIDMVPMDMHSIVHGLNCRDIIRTAADYVAAYRDTVAIVPMHGDMTPWNMFVGRDEKIVLVDYERAGWHVAYYDLFHYVLQPMALGADHVTLARALHGHEWYDQAAHKINLIVYLMDQIYFDLDNALRKRYRHAFSDRLIAHKTRWLAELVQS